MAKKKKVDSDTDSKSKKGAKKEKPGFDPLEKTKPTEKKKKAAKTKPAEKKKKAEKTKPAEKKKKAEKTKPAEKKKKAEKTKPAEKKKGKKEKVEVPKTLEEELEEQLTDAEIENFQIEKMDMDKLTNKVCEIIAKYELSGMLQSELWKKLKLNSRDGSRLALKLERMGFINREKILEKGRWTYKLILKKTPISTVSMENAPCLICPVEQKCSLEGEVSPRTCQWIEEWVLAETKSKKEK